MDIQAEIKEIDKQINDEDNGLNGLLITINEPLNDQNGATDIH